MRLSWKWPTTLLLLASGAACSGGDGTGPTTPASMVAAGGENQAASVGTPVPVQPSVRVLDARSRPVAGVAVTFSVTSGGGSVGGGAATTDANGVAAVTQWVLGTTPGPNTLSATVAGLPAIGFTATANVGPAAIVTKVDGDGQSNAAGRPLSVTPAVKVTDSYGNPISGAVVSYLVAGGGGAIAGTPASTGTDGIARAGTWTLGLTLGANSLSATAGALPPALFTATALDPCLATTSYEYFTLVSSTLDTLDCRRDTGERIRFYSTSPATGTDAVVFLRSSAFDAYVRFYDAKGNLVAFQNEGADNKNARLHILAPPGPGVIGATTFNEDQVGSFTLSSQAGASITGCEDVWVVPGITTNQTVSTGDCAEGGYYWDAMRIFLHAGQTVTLTMRSTAFNAFLDLYGTFGKVAQDDDGAGGTDARITYTAPSTDLYVIGPKTLHAGSTGAYSLTVQ